MTMPRVRPPGWRRHLLRTVVAQALIGVGGVSLVVSLVVTSPPPHVHADPLMPTPVPTPTATLTPTLGPTATYAPGYPSQPAAFAQRDYFVHIQPDGSVQVTEHWQLTFAGDPVSVRDGQVQLWLALALDQSARIDVVQVLGADPGTASVNSGSTYDSSYTKAYWRFNSRQSPAASSPPSTWTTFEVTYVIQGALGLNASHAWFDWQFLDGGSREPDIPVAESTISITLPQRTPARAIRATATDPDHTPAVSYVHGDTVVATATGLEATHPFEVQVIFPRDEVTPKVDPVTDSPSWQDGSPPRLPSAPGHPIESVQFGPIFYGDGRTSDPVPGPEPLGGPFAVLVAFVFAMSGVLAYPMVMNTFRRRMLVRRGVRRLRSHRKPPDT